MTDTSEYKTVCTGTCNRYHFFKGGMCSSCLKDKRITELELCVQDLTLGAYCEGFNDGYQRKDKHYPSDGYFESDAKIHADKILGK